MGRIALYWSHETTHDCRRVDDCAGIAGRNTPVAGFALRSPAPRRSPGGSGDDLPGGRPAAGRRSPNRGILGSAVRGRGPLGACRGRAVAPPPGDLRLAYPGDRTSLATDSE